MRHSLLNWDWKFFNRPFLFIIVFSRPWWGSNLYNKSSRHVGFDTQTKESIGTLHDSYRRLNAIYFSFHIYHYIFLNIQHYIHYYTFDYIFMYIHQCSITIKDCGVQSCRTSTSSDNKAVHEYFYAFLLDVRIVRLLHKGFRKDLVKL